MGKERNEKRDLKIINTNKKEKNGLGEYLTFLVIISFKDKPHKARGINQ